MLLLPPFSVVKIAHEILSSHSVEFRVVRSKVMVHSALVEWPRFPFPSASNRTPYFKRLQPWGLHKFSAVCCESLPLKSDCTVRPCNCGRKRCVGGQCTIHSRPHIQIEFQLRDGAEGGIRVSIILSIYEIKGVPQAPCGSRNSFLSQLEYEYWSKRPGPYRYGWKRVFRQQRHYTHT